jgi:peroxiredoxin
VKQVIKVGDRAPSFSLADASGGAHSLEKALATGPVLLAFFKVSCPTCQYAFPFLDRLHREFAGKGAAVWGVSQDDAQASRNFAADFKLSFPILIDAKPYEVSNQYGVSFTPTIFLVGRDSGVRVAGDGFSKQDLLDAQKTLARELAVKPGDLFAPGERIPEFKPG